jgi:hypothetical protein
MKLQNARICISCEEVHESWQCPVCFKGPSYFLTNWIKQLSPNKIDTIERLKKIRAKGSI